MTSVSFSTTDERIKTIDQFIKNHKQFPDRSTFINESIDLQIRTLETKRLQDFMYYIGLPALAFFGSIGITLYLSDLFFFILSGILGIYLIILIFLFWNKYKRRKTCQ